MKKKKHYKNALIGMLLGFLASMFIGVVAAVLFPLLKESDHGIKLALRGLPLALMLTSLFFVSLFMSIRGAKIQKEEETEQTH